MKHTEFYKYDKYYQNLENGVPRINGIKKAINAAREKQDWENALNLYAVLIEEDIFHNDSFQAIIIFPEYLALFEKYPEYQPACQKDIMWCYKWLLGSIKDSWQLSLEQIKNIFEQYAALCNRFNYSKRTYYRQLSVFIYEYGLFDLADVHECRKKMWDCPRDGLSEIMAGETDDEVKYILAVEKDVSKALKKAQPIFRGEMSCNTVPLYTYAWFAEYYFESGNLEEAKKSADKCNRLICRDFGNDNSCMTQIGICLSVFALTDSNKALKLFKKYFDICFQSRAGRDNLYFYKGCYHLMTQLEKSGQKTIRMSLPSRTEPFYNPTGVYKISELKEFMYTQMKFYADKFDERNKNTFLGDWLKKSFDEVK